MYKLYKLRLLMLSIGYYGLKAIKQLASDKPQDTHKSVAKDVAWTTSDLIITGLALGAIGVGIAALFLAPGMAAFIGTQGSIILAAGGGGLLAASILGGVTIQHLAKKTAFKTRLHQTLCQEGDIASLPIEKRTEIAAEMKIPFFKRLKKPNQNKINLTKGSYTGPNTLISCGNWETDHTWTCANKRVQDTAVKNQVVDFVYVGGTKQAAFGVAFDEVGHAKTTLQWKQSNETYSQFVQMIEKDLASTNFQSIAEAKGFVRLKSLTLGQLIDKKNQDNKTSLSPSVSLALVIQIGTQKHLLSAHYGDTFIVLKKNDNDPVMLVNDLTNTGRTTRSPDQSVKDGQLILPKIRIDAVNQGDEIYLFTDGIGDYLTPKEIIDLINENQAQLVDFKKKIKGRGRTSILQGTKGANGKRLRTLDPSNDVEGDDIGMAIMIIA